MKKIFIILFVLSFAMCKKDDKTCWDCYIKDNMTDEIVQHEIFCGYAEDELVNIPMKPEPGKTYRICYNKEFLK